MSTLAEFLLARIAEREELARRALAAGGWFWQGEFDDQSLYDGQRRKEFDGTGLDTGSRHRAAFIVYMSPARVLAECEAKRRIVELAETASGMDQRIESEWGMGGGVPWEEDQGVYLLRLLALPCASHPDYRDEWKP